MYEHEILYFIVRALFHIYKIIVDLFAFGSVSLAHSLRSNQCEKVNTSNKKHVVLEENSAELIIWSFLIAAAFDRFHMSFFLSLINCH